VTAPGKMVSPKRGARLRRLERDMREMPVTLAMVKEQIATQRQYVEQFLEEADSFEVYARDAKIARRRGYTVAEARLERDEVLELARMNELIVVGLERVFAEMKKTARSSR